jgi:putative Ca2+/H+ antiporter (TMEM165/GDT1 family)
VEASKLFFSVYAVVFAAELPDKTALTSLVMATRHRAFPVFAGAALALGLQTAIAVAAGSVIGLLPARAVHIGAGILFLVSAIVMWRRPTEAPEPGAAVPEAPSFGKAFATTFAMVFAAEWGDLTQLATAGFAAREKRPFIVFCAAAAALWSVSAIAIFVGNRAGKLLNAGVAKRVAAVLFAAVGILLLTGVL